MDLEYDFLDKLFYMKHVRESLIYDRVYRLRNRYTDILPYAKSRVKLTTGVNLEMSQESDYINACYVNSPFSGERGDKKIIASQGPLPETTDDFWQMIIEQNVTMIVSTCRT